MIDLDVYRGRYVYNWTTSQEHLYHVSWPMDSGPSRIDVVKLGYYCISSSERVVRLDAYCTLQSKRKLTSPLYSQQCSICISAAGYLL